MRVFFLVQSSRSRVPLSPVWMPSGLPPPEDARRLHSERQTGHRAEARPAVETAPEGENQAL